MTGAKEKPTKPTVVETKNRSEWLKLRAQTIGGSDIPILFNTAFKSQTPLALALRLRGELIETPSEPEENDFFAAANAVEPLLRRKAGQALGGVVLAPQSVSSGLLDPKDETGPTLYYSEAAPHQHVTPDGWLFKKRPERVRIPTMHRRADAVVSLKTTSWDEESWEKGPTPYALLQLQAELLVTGCEVGHIHLMVGLGKRHETFRDIPAHPGVQARILEKVSVFWERYVVGGENPEPTAADSSILRDLYPRSEPGKMVFLSGMEWKNVLAQRESYQTARKVAEENLAAVDAQLKMALGDAEAGVTEFESVVYWRSSERKYAAKPAHTVEVRTLRVGKPDKEVQRALESGTVLRTPVESLRGVSVQPAADAAASRGGEEDAS